MSVRWCLVEVSHGDIHQQTATNLARNANHLVAGFLQGRVTWVAEHSKNWQNLGNMNTGPHAAWLEKKCLESGSFGATLGGFLPSGSAAELHKQKPAHTRATISRTNLTVGLFPAGSLSVVNLNQRPGGMQRYTSHASQHEHSIT